MNYNMKYLIRVMKVTEREIEMPHMRPTWQTSRDEEVIFSADMDSDDALAVVNMLHNKQLQNMIPKEALKDIK